MAGEGKARCELGQFVSESMQEFMMNTALMAPVSWLSFIHGEQVQKGEGENRAHQVFIDFSVGKTKSNMGNFPHSSNFQNHL